MFDDYFDPLEPAANDPLIQSPGISPMAQYMGAFGISDPDEAQRRLMQPLQSMTPAQTAESDQRLDAWSGVRMRTHEEAAAEAARLGRVTWGETLAPLVKVISNVPFVG